MTNKNIMIAPSLMCMDLTKFSEQLTFLDDKVDYYHVDIMDGHFVPNITLSPFFVSEVKKIAKKPIDCHLMVTDPINYIDELGARGADIISLQVETLDGKAFRIIDKIKKNGMKCGLVFNPNSSIELAQYYIEFADIVTIMTVDPGFAGQPFIENMLLKIKEFKKYKEEKKLKYIISIDGGCNHKTFSKLLNAGAESLIVGSSGFFGYDSDITKAWKIMTEYLNTSKSQLN